MWLTAIPSQLFFYIRVMKKTLFFALVVAYIITAFGLGDGFEMNLIPFNWDIFLLIKFAIFFILTVIIESFFIKKKK